MDLVTPDPADCLVEPRTVENMQSFVGTPAASPAASAQATPWDAVGNEGVPADDESVDAVNAFAYDLYACYNANSFRQVYALYTDDYLAREFPAEGISPEALELFATPIPPQAADARISITVRDVKMLDDGRIGFFIVSRDPLGDGSEVAVYYILVEQDGRYLVDDQILPPFNAG